MQHSDSVLPDSAWRSRVEAIRDRIASTCQRAQRSVADVTLIAVSKTVPAERIRIAVEAGLTVLGENRIQEAADKMTALADLRSRLIWHLIGHLQSNKARKALELFDVVQSVDSFSLAERLDRLAQEAGKKLPVLLEINLGDEVSKAGAPLTDALTLIEKINLLPHLMLQGLMAVPPFLANPEDVRPFFRRLRELREAAQLSGIVGDSFKELSMGMSHDFEIAIEEGATFVRIGTALFGARNYEL